MQQHRNQSQEALQQSLHQHLAQTQRAALERQRHLAEQDEATRTRELQVTILSEDVVDEPTRDTGEKPPGKVTGPSVHSSASYVLFTQRRTVGNNVLRKMGAACFVCVRTLVSAWYLQRNMQPRLACLLPTTLANILIQDLCNSVGLAANGSSWLSGHLRAANRAC